VSRGAGQRGLARDGSYDRGAVPLVGARMTPVELALSHVGRGFRALLSIGLSPAEARKRICDLAASLEGLE